MYLVFMMLVVPIWLQFVLIKRLIKLLDKTLTTEAFGSTLAAGSLLFTVTVYSSLHWCCWRSWSLAPLATPLYWISNPSLLSCLPVACQPSQSPLSYWHLRSVLHALVNHCRHPPTPINLLCLSLHPSFRTLLIPHLPFPHCWLLPPTINHVHYLPSRLPYFSLLTLLSCYSWTSTNTYATASVSKILLCFSHQINFLYPFILYWVWWSKMGWKNKIYVELNR